MTQRSSMKMKDSGSSDDKILPLVLKKNEGFLRRHLILSPTIIGKLLTTGILNDTVHTRIKGLSNEEQVDALLNILRRSGMQVFRKFIEVLRTSMDSWIADVLLETNIAEALLSGKRILFGDHLKTLEPFSIDLAYKKSIVLPHKVKENRQLMTSSVNGLNKSTPVEINLNGKPIEDYRGKNMMSSTYLQRTIVMFENERQLQESALNTLRQEETAIRDRLEKNLIEQTMKKKKQRSLFEIEKKLKQVSYENSQLSTPLPRQTNTKERLLNIHRFPRNRTFHFDSF